MNENNTNYALQPLITDTINFGNEKKDKKGGPGKKGKGVKGKSGTSWGACIGMIVAAVIICSFAKTMVHRADGDSMTPTVLDNDWIIVNIFDKEPERGDLVSIRYPDGVLCLKRVIGLPGDRIDISPRTGVVRLNGERLEEDYILKSANYDLVQLNYGHCKVPEGQVYVMGDNREVSDDSRNEGPMPIENIVGKAYVFTFNSENK